MAPGRSRAAAESLTEGSPGGAVRDGASCSVSGAVAVAVQGFGGVGGSAGWRGTCWRGLGRGRAQNGDDHKVAAPPCVVCRRWTCPGHAKIGMGEFLPAPGSKKDGVFTTARQIENPTSLMNKLFPNSQLGLCRIFKNQTEQKGNSDFGE